MGAFVTAVVNQKGGIGKTTAAIHIGVGLQNRGYKTLIVDMDAQCNLTFSLRGDYQHKSTIMDAILKKVDIVDCIQKLDEVDIVPGSANLNILDSKLKDKSKEFFLEDTIKPIKDNYDFIIIDSPPALSLNTVGIMVAADSLIIPVGMDAYSLQGTGQLYRTYAAVKKYCNPSLALDGVLVTKNAVSFRRQLQETVDSMHSKIFDAKISQNPIVTHAALSQQSLYKYAPDSLPAKEYYALIDELLTLRKLPLFKKVEQSKEVSDDEIIKALEAQIAELKRRLDEQEKINMQIKNEYVRKESDE